MTDTQKNDHFDMNRRTFVAGSAAATGAGILAASVPNVHAEGSGVIKVALVGCGGRGTGAASHAMNVRKGIKVVAIADVFEDKVKKTHATLSAKYPDQFDVPADRQFWGFDAFQKAIDSGCDLVILATPPGFRPPHLDYAVKAGKHVFMEKPVATDAPGIRSVLASAELAKKKNTALAVGLQRRHENQYKETIQRIQDGAIGDVMYGRVYWNSGGVWVRDRAKQEKDAGRKVTEMEYQMRNWYYFNWLCGDHITEQHIHNLDVMNWIKNDFPISAEAQGGRQVRTGQDHGEIYDHFFVQYDYADGSRMFSQCRHIRNCKVSVSEHVYGTKGSSNVGRSIIQANDADPWRFEGKRQGGHQQEWHDLIGSLDKGEIPNEGEYGAKSTMTSILGRMAAYSGKEVTWDAAINSQISLMPDKLSWDTDPLTMPDADGKYKIPMPGSAKVV